MGPRARGTESEGQQRLPCEKARRVSQYSAECVRAQQEQNSISLISASGKILKSYTFAYLKYAISLFGKKWGK